MSAVRRFSYEAGFLILMMLALFPGVSVVWDLYARPALTDWRYGANPFSVSTEVSMERVGDEIIGSLKLHKLSRCDMDERGLSPAFYPIWTINRGSGGSISTGEFMILSAGGEWREIRPRNVIEPGQSIMIGPIRAHIPDGMQDAPVVSLKIAISCDPGDGTIRTWTIPPELLIRGNEVIARPIAP